MGAQGAGEAGRLDGVCLKELRSHSGAQNRLRETARRPFLPIRRTARILSALSHRRGEMMAYVRSLSLACFIAAGATMLSAAPSVAQQTFRNPTANQTIAWLPGSQPDARIRYGDASPVQFGDLRLPKTPAPQGGYPVALFIHGGAWSADWTKDYSNSFVEALTNAGVATWDIEFRRLGNQNAAYPAIFADVAAGADYLRTVARSYPLDLHKVVAVGHSSGGHLALWLAGRKNLPKSSKLFSVDPLPLAGVVSLAGVNDLEASLTIGKRVDVLDVVGVKSAQEAADRFPEASPARLLPFGVPQVLIVGTRDNDWRIAMTKGYAALSEQKGDKVKLVVPEGANHFDVVDPKGPLFATISQSVLSLANAPAP